MPKVSTSWKPGQSGNPNGRPKKGMSLTELMKDFLDNAPEGKEKLYKEKFIENTYKLAMEGDVPALKLIWNYVDGMPQQKIDHTTKGEKIYSWGDPVKADNLTE